MLYHLVYTSTAKEEFSRANALTLLIRFRKNNLKNGITGFLLYYDLGFIQYLEGPEKNVLELYQKITQDPLHYNLEIFSQGPIRERVFECWDLEFRPLKKQDMVNFIGCDNIKYNKTLIQNLVSLVKTHGN
jgi:hypothetical protein